MVYHLSARCPREPGVSIFNHQFHNLPVSYVSEVEREARKALNRLRRAVEKSSRELDSLSGAIRHAGETTSPQMIIRTSSPSSRKSNSSWRRKNEGSRPRFFLLAAWSLAESGEGEKWTVVTG